MKADGWMDAVCPALMPAAALAATATESGTVTRRLTPCAAPAAAVMVGCGGVPSCTGLDQSEVLVPVAVVAATVSV